MLEPFGVSTATEARLDLFAAVPPVRDMAEYERSDTTTLTLKLGEITRLRGALRHVINNLLGGLNDAAMVASMTGTPLETLVAQAGVDFEQSIAQVCDIEDALASAWAAAEASAVDFTVPDYAPDPSL